MSTGDTGRISKTIVNGVDMSETAVNTMHTHREFMEILARAEKAEAELAALKEQTRWRRPDEKPAKEYVVEVMLDDGTIHDDLICFNGEWLSNDNVLFWREADFPAIPEP